MNRDFCEKHPQEQVQYCSQCLRETRLATRQESAAIAEKLEAYREAVLGPAKKKRDKDENIP